MRHAKQIVGLVALLGLGSAAWPAGQTPPVPQTPPPPAVGTGFIAGQVVDVPSGRPIPEATVGLIGRTSGPAAGRGGFQAPTPVITDAQGRFFFGNLPTGIYGFQTAKAGYVVAPASVGQAIEVKDGERVLDFRIRLAKLGSLSGTLRDEVGDPVVGTDVIVFRRGVVNGRPSMQASGKGRSDDRGAYRIGGLQAGDYVVCACARDTIPIDGVLLTTLGSEPLQLMNVAARALTVGSDVVSLDNTLRTFPPTLYQNSASLSRATKVALAPGDEKTGIDMNLQLVHATRVSGTVVGAPGPVQAASMRLVPAPDGETIIDLFSIQPMLVQADGRFDFATVPLGQYRLVVVYRDIGARGGGPSGAAMAFVGPRGATPPPTGATMSSGGPPSTEPPLWANEPVTVSDNGVTGMVVTLNRAPRITGRVQWIGSAPQPPAQMLNRATVTLQSVSADPVMLQMVGTAIGRFAPDATFLVPGAVPGKYIVNATALPGFPTLKSVVVGGLDVTDLALEVAERDISDVVITYVDTPMATLTVNVSPPTATGSRANDDASVLVFPADRKYWTDPAAARRRFRNWVVTPTGTSTTPEMPAGEYVVVVVTGLDAVDWMEATKLDALSRRGQRVTISETGAAQIGVRR